MCAVGPDHGSDERVEQLLLLRGAPPVEALDWVSRTLAGAKVVECEVLKGGSSSAMHVVTVSHPDGSSERVVLRRYVLPEDGTGLDLARREAAALEVAAGTAIPTPRLLGLDPDGTEADAPAVLMSELGGQPIWETRDRPSWCEGMAEALVAVHGSPLPEGTAIPRYRPHAQKQYVPPRWASRPSVWERAIEISAGPAPVDPPRFIHRDFHPGNVLWHRGRITGLVDWQLASLGPPVVDVGHNRLNLFFYDPALADQFTATWERLAGDSFHPWADIVAIIGALDQLRASPPNPRARTALEDALADAVASM